MAKQPQGVGVVVGRFQVNDLHAGHLYLLHRANLHKKIIVFIGCHPFLVTRENPLDYPTRAAMIQSYFQRAMVFPILDCPTDEEWSMRLDEAIRTQCPLDEVTLYSGRDGFAPHYHGQFKVEMIEEVTHKSGTEIRTDVGQEVLTTEDFRRGVIYASLNQYRKINPCVDIAMVKKSYNEREHSARTLGPLGCWSVLLGRKKGEKKWRFPGGFVDPEDQNYEATAKRELHEETGMVAEGAMRYVGDFRVEDWRSSPSCAIFTNLYWIEYSHGLPKAGDDLNEVAWWSIGVIEEHIDPAHLPLAIALKEALKHEAETQSNS